MKTFTLYRMKENKVCTLGRLESHDSQQICVTLENPYVDMNKDGLTDRDISRIPGGEYRAFRRLSPTRGYEVFQLEDVPGRTLVQIHKGNTPRDTHGCILVGSAWGQDCITGSKLAFDKLMAELKGVDEFTLKVVDIR